MHEPIIEPMNEATLIPSERIEQKIYLLRGHKVIFSSHLAELYEVQTKVLVQAVKRNIERFPADFMFQLTDEEFEILKSQFVTSSWGGARRANPYAFTEQGVAMLSAVLHSPRAIQVSIEIVRTFVKLREFLISNKELSKKLSRLEKKYDYQFKVVFDTIKQMIAEPSAHKRKIGFS